MSIGYSTSGTGSTGAIWTPEGITTASLPGTGIPAGTDLGTAPVSIGTTLQQLFYPYSAPQVTLSIVPSPGVREFGNSVASTALTANTVRRSNPITLVEFYLGASLIHTQASPIPGGGAELYTYPTPVTTTSTFTARVGDGTSTTTSNTQTYTFVYPYYYGVGAPGLTGAQIGALTKLVQTQQNTNTITSPTAQVYYFAYPASYPVLTSILDASGFETIGDYIVRTVSIVGLDTTLQTYRVYEFNHLTTQTAFLNRYIY